MMGIELDKWPIYSEPAQPFRYPLRNTRPTPRAVAEMNRQMGIDNDQHHDGGSGRNPRPGLINALLQLRIDGEPAPDLEILGNLGLINRRRLRHHDPR